MVTDLPNVNKGPSGNSGTSSISYGIPTSSKPAGSPSGTESSETYPTVSIPVRSTVPAGTVTDTSPTVSTDTLSGDTVICFISGSVHWTQSPKARAVNIMIVTTPGALSSLDVITERAQAITAKPRIGQ